VRSGDFSDYRNEDSEGKWGWDQVYIVFEETLGDVILMFW